MLLFENHTPHTEPHFVIQSHPLIQSLHRNTKDVTSKEVLLVQV